MGEAFGDFDALEYLNEDHYAPVPGSDPWTEGAYVTGNHYNGIRDFLASEPMGGDLPEPGHDPRTNPLNLGDYGFDIVGPEVHADGEIWVAVQYDIRDLLLDRYPAKGAAARHRLRSRPGRGRECPGDRRWIQLYYDSMVLMPRNATILQARDAMLAADMARFGGAEPRPALAGLRPARLRPARDRDGQRRHRPGAGLLVAAREQRDAHLRRRRRRRERVP